LFCERIIVAKSNEEKTASNLAESSKVGDGSKKAVLPMMVMNIIITCISFNVHHVEIPFE
jgi:hypothetical protein